MLSERAQEGGERVRNKIIKAFKNMYLVEETKKIWIIECHLHLLKCVTGF